MKYYTFPSENFAISHNISRISGVGILTLSVEDMQKIVDANEKLVKGLKDAKD